MPNLTKLTYLTPNKWRKYPRHGGRAPRHDNKEELHPKQYSSIFTLLNVFDHKAFNIKRLVMIEVLHD